jgi:hypothetical protein
MSVAREERTGSSSIDEHERRAARTRRVFALELDAAATASQRSARKLVPFLYGLAALGALLALVAVVRLTRRPTAALVHVSIPPTAPPARSRFLNAVLRAPLERGTLLTLAQLALQRFAAMEPRKARALLPALSSVAASSLADLQRDQKRELAARGRGEPRQS